MALINCPECGKQISEKAAMCVGCGFPIQEHLQSIKKLFLEYLQKFTCYYGNEIYHKDDFIESHNILLKIKTQKINESYLINLLTSYLKDQNADMYQCVMESNALHKRLYHKQDEEYIHYVNSNGDITNDYKRYAYFFRREFADLEFSDIWSFIKLYYFCGIGCERDLDLAYRVDSLLKLYDCDCSNGLAGIYENNPNAKYLVAIGYKQLMDNEDAIDAAYTYGRYINYPNTYIYPLYSEDEEWDGDIEKHFQQFMIEAANNGCIEAIAWQLKEIEEDRDNIMDWIHDCAYIENPITGQSSLDKAVTQDDLQKAWASIKKDDKQIIEGYKDLIKKGYIYYAYWLDKWIKHINWKFVYEKEILYDVDENYEPIVSKYQLKDINDKLKFLPTLL